MSGGVLPHQSPPHREADVRLSTQTLRPRGMPLVRSRPQPARHTKPPPELLTKCSGMRAGCFSFLPRVQQILASLAGPRPTSGPPSLRQKGTFHAEIGSEVPPDVAYASSRDLPQASWDARGSLETPSPAII